MAIYKSAESQDLRSQITVLAMYNPWAEYMKKLEELRLECQSGNARQFDGPFVDSILKTKVVREFQKFRKQVLKKGEEEALDLDEVLPFVSYMLLPEGFSPIDGTEDVTQVRSSGWAGCSEGWCNSQMKDLKNYFLVNGLVFTPREKEAVEALFMEAICMRVITHGRPKPRIALTTSHVDHMQRMNWLKTVFEGEKPAIHMLYDNFLLQVEGATAGRVGDFSPRPGNNTQFLAFSDIVLCLTGHAEQKEARDVSFDDLVCIIKLRFIKKYKDSKGDDVIVKLITVEKRHHMCFLRSLVEYAIVLGQLDFHPNQSLDDIAQSVARTEHKQAQWNHPKEPVFAQKTASSLDLSVPASTDDIRMYLRELGILANIRGIFGAHAFRHGAAETIKMVPGLLTHEYMPPDGQSMASRLLYHDVQRHLSYGLHGYYWNWMLDCSTHRYNHISVGDASLERFVRNKTGKHSGSLAGRITHELMEDYKKQTRPRSLLSSGDTGLRVPKRKNDEFIVGFANSYGSGVDDRFSKWKDRKDCPFNENDLIVLSYLRQKTPERFNEEDNILSEMILSFGDRDAMHRITSFLRCN